MTQLRHLPRAAHAALIAALACAAAPAAPAAGDGPFRRIATFPIFENTAESNQTAAEIVTSAFGGTLLVYTDANLGLLGCVDLADPYDPQPAGTIDVGGSPTSVAVLGSFALCCVDTSPDFVNPSGHLAVVDLATRTIVRTIDLGGQPDSIAIAPHQGYAAICIENQRDEDLGDGAPPQLPAGFLAIIDLVGPPAGWTRRDVDLTGIAALYPDDPEVEFVDINEHDVAAVTLQENNHVVLVDLPSGSVVGDFSCGAVDLVDVDVEEEGVIDPTGTLEQVLREPDAVAWLSNVALATANEGDLDGGSRGFTIWLQDGTLLHDSGNLLEHNVIRHGHYPEDRSENKGNEAEAVEFGRFGGERCLFVGSERSNAIQVFDLRRGLAGLRDPKLLQLLPTGIAPEGLHAIPERGLLVVACEEDDRAAKFRGSLMIYALDPTPNYPTLVSRNQKGTHLPIAWGAASGLAKDPRQADGFWLAQDSIYGRSKVFEVVIDAVPPAEITGQRELIDGNDLLLDALLDLQAQLPGVTSFDPHDLVNGDGSVNLDLEGIDADPDGGLWVCSEGGGLMKNGVSDASRPFTSPNLILKLARNGRIDHVALAPLALTKQQNRFGLEGIAKTADGLYVCFQREWANAGDPGGKVRIGRYDPATGAWSFVHYPLDVATSPNGGWVGLSEITWLGGDDFAVVERDDQGGPDARVKRIYRFSIAGLTFKDETQVASFDVVAKNLAIDLLAAGAWNGTGGFVPEKLEGMTRRANGDTFIVNDNDGLDDNNGETQLLELKGVLQ